MPFAVTTVQVLVPGCRGFTSVQYQGYRRWRINIHLLGGVRLLIHHSDPAESSIHFHTNTTVHLEGGMSPWSYTSFFSQKPKLKLNSYVSSTTSVR